MGASRSASEWRRIRAPHLAAAAGAPTVPFTSAWKLSTRFSFFGSSDVLAIVAGAQIKPKYADLGLAYGLAHHQDRDLVLILPAGTEQATLARVPWLDVPVTVWTFDPDCDASDPRPVVVPSRVEVLCSFADELETREHRLGGHSSWVEALIEWADREPDVVPTHRKTYLSWQCAGRAVLKIRRHRRGLAVTAGVQYSKKPIAFDEVLSEPMTSAQLQRAIAAARKAIAERLAGVDADHGEHRLQSVLAARSEVLGLTRMEREFPAFRPAGRSYIDFLARDAPGRIHIVETKIAGDEMLALQALDYYVWACAHREALAKHLGIEHVEPEIVVDVVAARKAPSFPFFGPYTAPQLEALDRSIDWRVHTVEQWKDGDIDVVRWPKKTLPDEKRVTARRHALRLQDHLRACAPGEVVGGVLHADPTDGIAPEALSAYRALEAAGRLHRRVDHVRSSQAFAINLFGPMHEQQVAELFRLVGVAVTTAERPILEWQDPGDRLRELQPARPHQTQVDVSCRGVDEHGRRHILFVEVKLTETDFGHCSGFTSEKNDARAVCCQPGAFGGDRARCFILRNHDGPHRRRYDEFVRDVAGDDGIVGCAFRLGVNQPMRNVALATALLDEGEADVLHFALCAPAAHQAIWRRWRTAKSVLRNSPVHFHDLDASEVGKIHPEPLRSWLEERYRPHGVGGRAAVGPEGAERSAAWDGVTRSSSLNEWVVVLRRALTEALGVRDWQKAVALVSEHRDLANAWALDDASFDAPLHRMAANGAPVEVALTLIDLGAWRGLRNAAGELPVDLATARSHVELAAVLEPVALSDVPRDTLMKLQAGFHEVILDRAAEFVREHDLRLPQLEPLLELAAGTRVWFPVPGMYGGFAFWLTGAGQDATLMAESWCRVVEGSGQRHEVRADGWKMVEKGFV